MEKWYIGQPIVCIKTPKYGNFKKGDEFVIKGLRKKYCICSTVLIDIGLLSDIPLGKKMRCYDCGGHTISDDLIMWKCESLFAPLDVNISELTNILESPLTII